MILVDTTFPFIHVSLSQYLGCKFTSKINMYKHYIYMPSEFYFKELVIYKIQRKYVWPLSALFLFFFLLSIVYLFTAHIQFVAKQTFLASVKYMLTHKKHFRFNFANFGLCNFGLLTSVMYNNFGPLYFPQVSLKGQINISEIHVIKSLLNFSLHK